MRIVRAVVVVLSLGGALPAFAGEFARTPTLERDI